MNGIGLCDDQILATWIIPRAFKSVNGGKLGDDICTVARFVTGRELHQSVAVIIC